jgi:hypothetical protein
MLLNPLDDINKQNRRVPEMERGGFALGSSHNPANALMH